MCSAGCLEHKGNDRARDEGQLFKGTGDLQVVEDGGADRANVTGVSVAWCETWGREEQGYGGLGGKDKELVLDLGAGRKSMKGFQEGLKVFCETSKMNACLVLT